MLHRVHFDTNNIGAPLCIFISKVTGIQLTIIKDTFVVPGIDLTRRTTHPFASIVLPQPKTLKRKNHPEGR
jgi:hypothetical protein